MGVLEMLPPCMAQRKCMIVSLVDCQELAGIPAERVVVVWKG